PIAAYEDQYPELVSKLDYSENEKARVTECTYFCFILGRFGELEESVIGKMILSAAPSLYFDVMGNIGFMLEKGLIGVKKDPETGTDIYFLLDEGKRIASDLSPDLSPILKNLTINEGTSVLTDTDREKSIRCSIDHRKNRYDLNVRFLNELSGDTVLYLSLYAPDEKKALEMKKRFLSRSSEIITGILGILLKDRSSSHDEPSSYSDPDIGKSLKFGIIHDEKNNRYDLDIEFINELSGEVILDLMIYAPDKEKAENIKKCFLSHPSGVITGILDMFLKDDIRLSDKGDL
ncbi:MAG: DUF4364 family protein, partial [Ruminiclostridium sp.]|nr:DUF4364 family protein [Ruminiclostridium sp.]